MTEYIARDGVLAEYDHQHQGPPGGARKIIAEYPAADVVERPRWIPVGERLPKDEKEVLACYGFRRDGEMNEMRFIQPLCYLRFDKDPHWQYAGFNGLEVTHWMPLPEPPKGKP